MLPFIIAVTSYALGASFLLILSWNGFDFDSHSLRVPFGVRHKIRMGHINIRSVSLKWLEWEPAEYGREGNVQLSLRKAIAISNLNMYVNKIARPTWYLGKPATLYQKERRSDPSPVYQSIFLEQNFLD